MMADLRAGRIGEGRVADILRLIADTPGRRETAAAGDVAGEFDYWFDGGACRLETGVTRYVFTDGSRASVVVLPYLGVGITFPDGEEVSVVQRRDPAPGDSASVAPARYCIYCGCRDEAPSSERVCASCGQGHPDAPESATMVECPQCCQWNLACAAYCERCGASVGVGGA
jgi:hypothetical protein